MDSGWVSAIDANTGWVLAACSLLGLSSGLLGSFSLLRRRSLLGDALAHAALPGICIAYLLTGQKQMGWILLGAAIAGGIGTMLITWIPKVSKVKEDAAMAIVLTVFFGVGLMLLGVIMHSPRGNQTGLDKFLFGQAAAMVSSDVQLMAVVAAGLALIVALLFKEFKLLAFDPGFATGIGLPTGILDLLLNLLLVVVVVIGLQSVGVVLMAALLVTPAVAARYWTDRLAAMVLFAGGIGAVSGAAGTLLSQLGPKMPTGPLIVLSTTSLFVISLLAAPRRGLVARSVQFLRTKRKTADVDLLRRIYEWAEAAPSANCAMPISWVAQPTGVTNQRVAARLRRLQRKGMIEQVAGGLTLTVDGLHAAHRLVLERRMWEVYLMHEGELGFAGADRDANGAERFSPALRQELDRLLRLHGLVPKLRPETVGEGA